VRRDPFSSPIVLDGQVVGGWKRALMKQAVAIALDLPRVLKQPDERLVAAAARRVAAFLGLDARDVRR
jgi:hypothetical protein